MNGQEKPVGERLAVLEESSRNLGIQFTNWTKRYEKDFADWTQRYAKDFAELKDMANPRFKTVDELEEWKRIHERAEDARDRKLGRYIAFGFGIMTCVLATVQIIIALAK